TAWGVYPEVGRSHVAVFELAEPVELSAESTLIVRLEQVHGGGRLIGRLRLSLTNAAVPLPVQLELIPREIAETLRTPPGERTDRDRTALAALMLLEQVERDLAALPLPQKVYVATNEFQPDGTFRPATTPRPVHVLHRGNINHPGALAEPA